MTLNNEHSIATSKRRYRHRKVWSDRTVHSRMLGCQACIDLDTCGGLSVRDSVISCLDYCCGAPENCDIVCKLASDKYVGRVREVNGFSLSTVRRTQPISFVSIPAVVPLIYHGSRRNLPFEAEMICLPFNTLLDTIGSSLNSIKRTDITAKYRIRPETRLMLTGISKDIDLEKWWGFSQHRIRIVRTLKRLGFQFVTSPNFSVFAERPRWDDMHSMKRIAIAHEEFQSEGIRAALHVNARTERDYERWSQYVASRNEISDVAFEFRTGARFIDRTNWHVKRLCELANYVNQPLHLTIRASPNWALQPLSRAFAGITIIESSVFMKTMKRQRGFLRPDGSIGWMPIQTERNQPLDELLRDNWNVCRSGTETQLSLSVLST